MFYYNNINLSINSLYYLLKGNINKQNIIDLLYKYNGVEIYNIEKCNNISLVKDILFYCALRYNININYQYYLNKYMNIEYSKPLIAFNGTPIPDYFIYKLQHKDFSIYELREIYKCLNNIKLKK